MLCYFCIEVVVLCRALLRKCVIGTDRAKGSNIPIQAL